MSEKTNNQKPLVLLDVDGVINDLGALSGQRRVYEVERVLSHGHVVHIPDYMGWLIRKITDVAEVHWCTTWRHRANDEIASHLGIDSLSVVDDGTNSRYVSWKAAAAHDLVDTALKQGRQVVWIEDFYGDPPVAAMPVGTQFVDTAKNHEMVLQIEMLPAWLLELFDSSTPVDHLATH